MYRFPEAAAIHIRLGNEKNQGDEGEGSHQNQAYQSHQLAPDTGNQGCAGTGLDQGNHHPREPGQGAQESQVEEVEILSHDERGTHRVHKFQDSGDEEYYPQKHCAKPSYGLHIPF